MLKLSDTRVIELFCRGFWVTEDMKNWSYELKSIPCMINNIVSLSLWSICCLSCVFVTKTELEATVSFRLD